MTCQARKHAPGFTCCFFGFPVFGQYAFIVETAWSCQETIRIGAGIEQLPDAKTAYVISQGKYICACFDYISLVVLSPFQGNQVAVPMDASGRRGT